MEKGQSIKSVYIHDIDSSLNIAKFDSSRCCTNLTNICNFVSRINSM